MKVSASVFASEARADGTAPVYLTIRHGNRRALLPLASYGVPNVKPRDWNARSGSVRRGTTNEATVNVRISEAVATAERLHVEHVFPTSAALRDATRAVLDLEYGVGQPEPEAEEEPPCFLLYCDDQVAGYLARGQVGTHDQYRAVVDKLRRYVSTDTVGGLPYPAVTPALVRGFYAWLLAPEPAGLGNRPNTARKAITTLRTFWTRAKREGKPAEGEPWHAITPRSERARKRKLTVDELTTLLTGELPPGSMQLWRDVFAFAFYCGGARFGDVCWMRRSDLRGDDVGGWRAAWRQQKTDSLHAVALAPTALECLDRLRPGWRGLPGDALLLPALDYEIARLGRLPATARERDDAKRRANARANKHLRRAALRLGLVTEAGETVPVSMHLARHSLAGYLLQQGADVRTIQRVLGHSSVTITERYLSGFDTAAADGITGSITLGQ